MYYERKGARTARSASYKNSKNKSLKNKSLNKARRQPPRRAVPRMPRHKRHLLLKALLALILAAALLLGGLYILPINLLFSHNNESLGISRSLPGGYTNVLLLGIDIDGSGTSRTDSMIIASIGSDGIKLTSLQRDTGVYIQGKTSLNRLNAAYRSGGAEATLKAINQNFGLDITRYALVDYDTFVELANLAGGADITISAAEASDINDFAKSSYYNYYKRGLMGYDEAYNTWQSTLLSEGEMHLNGIQALGYARIRHLDSDYGRTNRQRKLLTSLFKNALNKIKNPVSLYKLAKTALNGIQTNMSTLELIALAERALAAGGITAQTRLPVNGTYTDDGSMFYNVDYEKNREAFISFVYGQ